MELETLKELAQQILGPYYGVTRDFGIAFFPFIYSGQPLYWLFTLCFVVGGVLVYWLSEERGRRFSLKKAFAFVFPRRVWLHPSALLTYRFFVVNSVIRVGLNYLLVIWSIDRVGAWTQSGLTAAFGGGGGLSGGLLAMIFYSIVIALAFDFSEFLQHRLAHKIPALWELHKVHHIPEQITPVTQSQGHPIEYAMRVLFASAIVGPVVGSINFALLTPAFEITIVQVGIVKFLFYLHANFRHSHIWIAFPRWLSFVLSSPAMHQTHHGRAERYFNRNFAVVFSLWDWLFGTIYVPKERETIAFGIAGEEPSEFDSIWKLLYLPIMKAWRKLWPTDANGRLVGSNQR